MSENKNIDHPNPLARNATFLTTGRGTETHRHRVDLEPWIDISATARRRVPMIDDGRVNGTLAGLFRRPRPIRFNDDESPPITPIQVRSQEEEDPPSHAYSAIRVYLPREQKRGWEELGQALSSLAFASPRTSFEVVANSESVIFQIACPAGHRENLRQHLAAHGPQVDYRLAPDAIADAFANIRHPVFAEFVLGRYWFLPLAIEVGRAEDPLAPLLSVFENLEPGQAAALQILFERVRQPWQNRTTNMLFDPTGKPGFTQLASRSQAIKEKLSGQIFAVAVRLGTDADSAERSIDVARRAAVYFRHFSTAAGNELIPAAIEHDPLAAKVLIERSSYRKGMLLSRGELGLLARFPGENLITRKLERLTTRTKAVSPGACAADGMVIGVNEHAGETREVRISPALHSLVIGATGAGKSTYLLSRMIQNAEQGLGFAVLDPHGDLVDDLVARLPAKRLADTVLFDPSDCDHPLGFNILQANSELEKNFLASDLVETLRRHSTSWGDVMDAVIANACLAFVESSRSGTLFDLKRFLSDKKFREDHLKTVEDESIRYFWGKEFGEIRGRPQSSVLVRLDTFLRQKMIRNIVCQRDKGLNIRSILDGQKILLVKLSQGLVGESNSALLGTLILSKIHQIALTRQNIEISDRTIFPIYIDEAAHFVGNPSMSLILANLRKYGIALTLSIQNFRQLQNKDKDVADSVLANCQARICFRLGDTDAEKLASGFSYFDAAALQSLGRGEAIARIERSDADFNLRTLPPIPVRDGDAERKRRFVRDQTREKYASRREDVERALFPDDRQSGMGEAKAVRSIPITAPCSEPGREPAALPDQGPVRENSPGGGAHHRDLQRVIKRMAETNGFRAEIEKSVLDGTGRIDVAIEKENLQIGCEVSVNTLDYETHNIQKCLAAGYDYAIVVVANRKKIPLIKRNIDAEIPIGLQTKVRVLSLMDLLAFLRELSGPDEPHRKRKKPDGRRLSFLEACDLLDKSPSTIYRWLREGRIPFYRVGREYEFDRDELLLVGRHDLSGKRKATVELSPLAIEKRTPKTKKEQDSRYRKLLRLDKIEGPLHTRREKEANDN